LQYFEGQTFRDTAARKLTEKVHVAPYDDTRFDANNAYGAEVKITFQDGKSISKKLDAPLGQTLADPLLPKLVAEKFDNCARAALSTERVEEIKRTVGDLQTLTDLRKLTKLLEVNAG
jgi:2-methylcitrate dehydratase PrpD